MSVERQPAVAATRVAPVDDIDIDPLRQHVADQRTVFLQVGHREAADQASRYQHRRLDRVLAVAL